MGQRFSHIVVAMWKSSNSDHWRYLVSEMCDQLNYAQLDIAGRRAQNSLIHEKCANIIELNACAYYGKQFNTELPFELGGVGLRSKFRTRLGLKEWLLMAESFWEQDNPVYKKAIYTKTAFSYKPRFRPWKNFPEGTTKKTFEEIGIFKGIYYELSNFLDKAQSKFIVDRDAYNNDFWSNFSKMMDEADKAIEDHKYVDFYEWAKQENFFACAVPHCLVKGCIPRGDRGPYLPFVRIQKDRSQYSLASMMVNYINLAQGKNLLFPADHIDFSKVIQYEIPVYSDNNQYIPIVDIILLGKISKFHDPRRVFLDYAERTSTIITELETPDELSKDFLNLMKKAWGGDSYLDRMAGASWWTKQPIPFLEEWVPLITSTIPTLLERLLANLLIEFFEGKTTKVEPANFVIDEAYIKQHQKHNPKFWARALRSRKSSSKVKDPGGKVSRAKPDEPNPFLQLDMDQNLRLVEEFYSRQFPVAEEPKPPPMNDLSWMEDALAGVLNLEEPVFDENPFPQEEEVLDLEENEDDILAQFLDSNSKSWDQGYELEDEDVAFKPTGE
jgi:hypothetical protein